MGLQVLFAAFAIADTGIAGRSLSLLLGGLGPAGLGGDAAAAAGRYAEPGVASIMFELSKLQQFGRHLVRRIRV